jgi:hypothetical protein
MRDWPRGNGAVPHADPAAIFSPFKKMSLLSAFGLLAVSLMLLFYSLESRSPVCVLGFAVACLMGSAYGFLQGAWPFGLVEAVWSIVALRRWHSVRGRARYDGRPSGSTPI